MYRWVDGDEYPKGKRGATEESVKGGHSRGCDQGDIVSVTKAWVGKASEGFRYIGRSPGRKREG